MNALLRSTVLILVVWLQLSGVSFGKQVYLQDGGVLECESFWKRGEQVVVKVNRDIVLYFERSEIDTRRTFPPPRKKSRHLKRQKHGGAALTTGAAAPAARAAAISAPAAPAKLATEQPAPPAPAPVSAAKRIPLPERAPATPAAPAPALATPAAVSAASPAPSPALSAREEVQPEPAQPAPGDAASPPDKAEMERRHLQAVALMAEAIQKRDPELMKKAMEAQRSAMEAQRSALPQNNKGRAAVLGLKFMLILLVISLLIIVSMWVILEKAGNSGWKSLVPIYNGYTLIEISGKPGWWVFLLFIPVVGFVFSLLAMLSLAEKFGRSALFGVGLALLPMFFFPMLAFGGSQYEQFELLEPEMAELV